jgi:hypothetical protein
MKYIIPFCLLSLLATTGHASFFVVCDFQVQVESVQNVATLGGKVVRTPSENTYTRLVTVKILAADSDERKLCNSYVNEVRTLVSQADVKQGDTLKVNWRSASTRAPDGGYSTEAWEIKK